MYYTCYGSHLDKATQERLSAREKMLNKSFVWTEENKARFLVVNNAFIDAIEKAHSEALKMSKEIDEKIKNGNNFFQYYDIEILLTPCIKGHDEMDSDEHLVTNYHTIRCLMIGGKENIYLNRKLNWNIEFLDNQFDDHYIGYCIHELLETCVWSFQDFLNIEEIQTEIVVNYENHIEV